MTIRMNAAACAIAAGLALTGIGCGGSDSKGSLNAAGAEKTVRTYMHDLIAKDGDAACALFTDSWKQQVEDQYAALSGSTGTTDCASLIDEHSNGRSFLFEGSLVTDPEVDKLDLDTSVDDNDGSPVATVKGAKGTEQYELNSASGEWRIARIGTPLGQ